MPPTPSFTEDHISQVPALQLFQNIGYTYLSPDEALSLRGGRESGVLMDGILENWLRENNAIYYKGETYTFTENNILSAIQALKDVLFDGLVRTNEKIYDLMTLGKSLQQAISGDVKSFSLKYIDWEQPEKNVYHVTEEFSVERAGSKETYRPDIILFVNGIPLCVIECKRPVFEGEVEKKKPIEQAISQHIRNQKDDGIPHLFVYSQLLLALSKNEAQYATTGTPLKFWAVWKEHDNIDATLREIINRPLADDKKEKLFAGRFKYVRSIFDAMEAEGGREVTEQDRAIYALCRPERLLRFVFRYLLYDAGEKKIARYQQFYCVENILERIRQRDKGGKRTGGVVWHTQGSGKSLTMVMLAKAIALEPGTDDYKIALVTDRVDLDDQIYRTFQQCGCETVQATTGKHLITLIEENKKRIVTTVIDKFDAALSKRDVKNDSPDIFVLVDEGHRGQYGPLHAKMRKMLPNACFIAFTGTPVIKKQKNTIVTFGGMVPPPYTITQAVEDKAVVPLLYEGRHVPQSVEEKLIDSWFEKITKNLTKEQAADLKKKFSTADQLDKSEQKIKIIAWDIGAHFKKNWQGTPFKAQLVCNGKDTALKYKQYLDEFDMVSSEVLISGPDDREGETDISRENKEAVNRFWKEMMKKYGTEKEYNRQLINSFKFGEFPEIIIVVDKLLTGFDAPKNTVLYLTRNLKEHSLLQAIARVNRLYEGKEYGYIIDYRGVLLNLDAALDLYSSLPEFDAADLAGTWTDVDAVIQTLPQKHSDLWDIFKEIKNKRDEEAYELLLADEAVRIRFYERFTDFAKTLATALSTAKFITETPQAKIDEYNRDLRFFKNLRASVRRRYSEVVDYSEYEPLIQKLIDTHVGAGEVETIVEQVNIFDTEKFQQEVERMQGDAARADTIAHRTMRTIEEKMQEDPAFYKKFSKMLQDAIDAFHQQRIMEAEYLKRAKDIMASVVNRTGDNVPEKLKHYEIAKAYYGEINDIIGVYGEDRPEWAEIKAELSIAVDEIIRARRIVNWTTNPDVQNQMRTDIEDRLFDLKEKLGIDLTFEDMDMIIEKCLEIAKVRYP
ncbi:MAG TPA: HsdR family type I site-specific deoxyribonuclease [Bacteroidales bacterium]|nr:HsdR family type I site-specific deoxyribonuclease [bacterium]HOY63685.1 HsdR family type I site-specific deoxyribonuclease [bacterium]HPI87185.1 HsdR family type I site-specific deoxyribonuclease [Bacteroidales bacterium]HPN95311.1 HsdR family type I site-specific deoxyribonuclease [bacterium]